MASGTGVESSGGWRFGMKQCRIQGSVLEVDGGLEGSGVTYEGDHWRWSEVMKVLDVWIYRWKRIYVLMCTYEKRYIGQ